MAPSLDNRLEFYSKEVLISQVSNQKFVGGGSGTTRPSEEWCNSTKTQQSGHAPSSESEIKDRKK